MTTQGVMVRPPVLAALVSVAGAIAIAMTAFAFQAFVRLGAAEQGSAANAVTIREIKTDQSETNKQILKELKAIRLGLAKAGVLVNVEP